MRSLLRWAERLGPGPGLNVFIFHRVVPQRDELFPGEVCAEEFDALCSWISQWHRVWPLEEAAERLASDDLPAGSACITFDDGYADNHQVALPILQRHGLTATFFVATGFLDGGRMWNDTVIEAVRACTARTVDVTALNLQGLGELPVGTIEERRESIRVLLAALKFMPPSQRQERVDHFLARSGVEPMKLPSNLMMQSAQVRDLVRRGMSVGAHTHRHPILSVLSEQEASEEIVRSREILQSLLSQPVNAFAYPNGRPGQDYTRRDVEIVKRLGFRVAVSTQWGVARRGSDVLQLPRFTPWDRTRWRFGLRLARELMAA